MSADNDAEVITTDHLIEHVTCAYGQAQAVQLFVRERRLAADAPRPVVLFVHGGTYPSAVDFDLDVPGYSWMQDLARLGFHVFAMDCVGYGGSSRPWMDDPGLERDEAAAVAGGFLRSPQSDWVAMTAVIGFIRGRTGAERLNLIGWSGGGPRAGGYAALHPREVDRLVLLAPAYLRTAPDCGPDELPERGPPLRTTSRARFEAAWDAEVRRGGQFDPAVRERVWSMNMTFDPVGASWDPPVVRSPRLSLASLTRGWNARAAAQVQAPTLLVTMEWDAHVPPAVVRELYEDVGAAQKVLATVGGASHYLPWEADRAILHRLAAEWLTAGTAAGSSCGVVTLEPQPS